MELEKLTLQGFKNVMILNINKCVTANFKKLNKKILDLEKKAFDFKMNQDKQRKEKTKKRKQNEHVSDDDTE
jgi:hypothetical protein